MELKFDLCSEWNSIQPCSIFFWPEVVVTGGGSIAVVRRQSLYVVQKSEEAQLLHKVTSKQRNLKRCRFIARNNFQGIELWPRIGIPGRCQIKRDVRD
jgi:hypothetical protein